MPLLPSTSRALGRAPRAYDPTIPHMSALRMAARRMLPFPPAVHWLDEGRSDWGLMCNDRLGCCTLAAAYHSMQVWSAHGRKQILTEPDTYVEAAYREFAGYAGTPETDNGAVEQDILAKWLAYGMPVREGTAEDPRPGRSYLLFYAEIDPRNIGDVCRAINDCGSVYIGFEVPEWLMKIDPLPTLWVPGTSDETIVGGHAVSLHGYDMKRETLDLISWGEFYQMSFAFFRRYVDEAYALCHPWFIDATGYTPLGLSVPDLEAITRARYRRISL